MTASVHLADAYEDGMKLALFRRFDDIDLPYVLEVNDTAWTMAFGEAAKFTHAARCWYLPLGKHHKGGARFTHEAAGADGRVFLIELGVDVGEGAEPDNIYFAFDGVRATGKIGEPGELARLLSTFAEDVLFLRQTGFSGGGGGGGPPGSGKGAGVNLRTFRSQYGWNGKAPWEK